MTITSRGRPLAMMVPIAAGRVETLVAAGLARPALRRASELPAPAPRPPDRSALTDLLQETRRAAHG